jgi:hypothetical protein
LLIVIFRASFHVVFTCLCLSVEGDAGGDDLS